MFNFVDPQDVEGKVIFIAGAAGFVPSSLAEAYLEAGAKVIGADNFITGSHSNIELLSRYENFEFHECDIIHKLPDFKNGQKIDYIFNLASPASPIDFKKIPLEIMRVNSEGTLRLLNLALEKNSRFLEASTSEVYGDPKIHPQTEDYFGYVNPIGERSCYDESKRYAEALVTAMHYKKGIDTRIVRIFNTYGPRMRPNDGRVIPNFINQALRGDNVTVYGDGTQTRSFCFVSDLVRAIHLVMFKAKEHLPYNIGNPDEYTIIEVAKKIIEWVGSDSKIEFLPMPKDDPTRRKPDISRISNHCNYRPEMNFSDGIKLTVEFFKALQS